MGGGDDIIDNSIRAAKAGAERPKMTARNITASNVQMATYKTDELQKILSDMRADNAATVNAYTIEKQPELDRLVDIQNEFIIYGELLTNHLNSYRKMLIPESVHQGEAKYWALEKIDPDFMELCGGFRELDEDGSHWRKGRVAKKIDKYFMDARKDPKKQAAVNALCNFYFEELRKRLTLDIDLSINNILNGEPKSYQRWLDEAISQLAYLKMLGHETVSVPMQPVADGGYKIPSGGHEFMEPLQAPIQKLESFSLYAGGNDRPAPPLKDIYYREFFRKLTDKYGAAPELKRLRQNPRGENKGVYGRAEKRVADFEAEATRRAAILNGAVPIEFAL